jgi:hypothetical protein
MNRHAIARRYVALELVPIGLFVVVMFVDPRYAAWVATAGTCSIVASVALSARDGVVLWRGDLLEKNKQKSWFWTFIVMRSLFGGLFLIIALILFIAP